MNAAVTPISDVEFMRFQRFIHDSAGITLSSAKKQLVAGRLAKRLAACGSRSYSEYFRFLQTPEGHAERQQAVDVLTTNETYFFREAKHFDWLRRHAEATHRPGQPFRVWSAACSSGEEAYSIAMVLADCLGGNPWEVVGTDICNRVLEKAARGQYSVERTEHIPKPYLRRFCLRGVGRQEGTLLINRELRQHVRFAPLNLNQRLPNMAPFDAIFLRNVMIYFNTETKRQVVARLIPALRQGGHFYIGHSETLNDITQDLRALAPATYCKGT
ncbi:protein-glutamate O-methyltransferase CheR [Oleiagrimonas sp. C23AA]|uniref:CheR family methyltransferase n=1 Tax=Oleiagrimonas sp. C23AA TaxID=2719047 RepID=UPI001422BF8E|nr:protein-glutamate O-methyltransferase CheR [Oleiagrimonas sp. C23AA]NII11751.1 protein-glutamate O-methyltransferase CheR [Oleiagrimonas sp. C23AA]